MDWEARYQEGDTPWEKGAPAPPLEEIVARFGTEIWGQGPVLVPGCGFGHDARWIAGQGVEVLGLDISELALEGARERTAGDNPRFDLGDFLKDPAGECSAIFEHTCFCAIDPSERPRYAQAVAQWLRPGDHLVAVFFVNPEQEKGPPFGCELAELDALFGADFELVAEWQPELAYPGREGREWVRILKKRGD